MKIYDLFEDTRGGHRLMSFEKLEDGFAISLTTEITIKAVKCRSKSTGEAMILRYPYYETDERRNAETERYIEKNYDKY